MDILQNMNLFVEVAASGGFRAAADSLGVPSSTVSRRIAALERELGLRLFNRTTRRVELTESGRIYYVRCRRIIDEARIAHEELAEVVANPSGVIRASFPVDFNVEVLTRIMAAFLERYPGIRLDLDLSPRRADLLSEPVDLTIRIGQPQEQSLIARRIGELNGVLFAAAAYLARRGGPLEPEDLAHHACLSLMPRPWTLLPVGGGVGRTINVDGPVVANNVTWLRHLALEGVGIAALVPAMTGPEIAEGRLVRVLPDWRLPAIPVYALTESRLLPARVRVFLDFLIERLARSG